MQPLTSFLSIETPRLQLIAANLETLEAEMRNNRELSKALGVEVPEYWPPELMDDAARRFWLDKLRANPEDAEWWGRYVVLKETGTLIGGAGFFGPPDARGEVMIGYSILDAYQRCGYATETTRALVAFAFASPETSACVADTFPRLLPSIRVLEKSGFVLDGDGDEPGAVRFRLTRTAWEEGRAG